jgi:hypothetical protein
MKAIKKPVRSEHVEQCHVFMWAATEIVRHPELEFMFAIPNGGKRNIITAARLKAEGVRAGVRTKGSKLKEPEQIRFQDFLDKQGYCVVICRGQEEAVEAISEYLKFGGVIRFGG